VDENSEDRRIIIKLLALGRVVIIFQGKNGLEMGGFTPKPEQDCVALYVAIYEISS